MGIAIFAVRSKCARLTCLQCVELFYLKIYFMPLVIGKSLSACLHLFHSVVILSIASEPWQADFVYIL